MTLSPSSLPIATLVTLVDLLLNAYAHALHQVLGLFIPLIVTNCVILGRAEAAARKLPLAAAASDGLAQGLGFTAVITLLGIGRELLASGKVFADAPLMIGPFGDWLAITLLADYPGLLLARLPPGGFFALGLLLVLYRLLKQRGERATHHGLVFGKQHADHRKAGKEGSGDTLANHAGSWETSRPCPATKQASADVGAT